MNGIALLLASFLVAWAVWATTTKPKRPTKWRDVQPPKKPWAGDSPADKRRKK